VPETSVFRQGKTDPAKHQLQMIDLLFMYKQPYRSLKKITRSIKIAFEMLKRTLQMVILNRWNCAFHWLTLYDTAALLEEKRVLF
jgi:hypothetical protein